MCVRLVMLLTSFVLAGFPLDAVAQPSNVLFYTHPAREWNQALAVYDVTFR